MGGLVTGDLRLEHRWKSREKDFACTSLFNALEQYRWPDNSHALDYRVTARRLREFSLDFEDMGTIDSRVKQAKFVDCLWSSSLLIVVNQQFARTPWHSQPLLKLVPMVRQQGRYFH